MKLRKLILPITIIGVLFVLPFGVWGGSYVPTTPPADIDGLCQMDNPGSGAIALRGTVAVEVTSGATNPFGSQEVDFTLRLERGPLQKFFRAHINDNIAAISNEELVCKMLNAHPVDSEGNDILTAFELSDMRVLVITNKSISDVEFGRGYAIPGTTKTLTVYDINQNPLTTYDEFGNPFPLIFGPHSSAMGDITIYAAKE